jgi:hypothetical protein
MVRNNFVHRNYRGRVSTELASAKASRGKNASPQCVHLGSRCDLLSSVQQLWVPHGCSVLTRIF